MKIRTGFVSNSSSSSFVCEITGTVESGMDLSLEDAGMYECINGHIFLDKFLIEVSNDPDIILQQIVELSKINEDAALTLYGGKTSYSWRQKEQLKADFSKILYLNVTKGFEAALKEFENHYDVSIDRYETSKECCPICTMQHFTNDDILQYILKSRNISRTDIETEIRSSYNYDDFRKVISI